MKRVFTGFAACLLLMLPVSAAADADSAPLYEASFLQGWYCREWTPDRWKTEFSDMQAAGFRAVILQSCADLTYEQTDSAQPKTNADSYNLVSAAALYPCSLVPDSESVHALDDALQAAAQTGMQVYIGTLSDNRWWNYGWGSPGTDFTAWAAENTAQNRIAVQEIWSRYGAAYGEQIAGFYYNNEIWNMDTACSGADRTAYAEILGGSIRGVLDEMNQLCPEKPLLISPFYNRDLSSAAEYGAFWAEIAEHAGFRQHDIFAHQDGAGRDYDAATLTEWTDALQAALGGQMRFWVNQECFTAAGEPISAELLRQNYLTAPQAERHILFSWNHYYHGREQACEFAAALQQMTGDINGDGICGDADVTCLMQWLLGSDATPANWRAADLDADGRLTAADLSLLKRRLMR